MSSVLRSIKKRKKSRRLGEVEVIGRDEYAEFDVDTKAEMIRALVPLGRTATTTGGSSGVDSNAIGSARPRDPALLLVLFSFQRTAGGSAGRLCQLSMVPGRLPPPGP